jgi:serine/threonine protein kinase
VERAGTAPDSAQITVPGETNPGLQGSTQIHQIPEYELEPGTTLGEYQIEGKIAEGGMGTVFAAVHPMIGKRAAIKVLKAELCRDRIVAERFVDEARAVNQIGHPNIVDIFSFGEMPDGRHYFAMEWLKGETLRDRLHRVGPMTLEEMAHVIRNLARALEAAHEKGIIHRDLKPENVFLVEMRDEPLHVKLLDFGVAKLAHALVEAESLRSQQIFDQRAPNRTYSGEILGTPMYIAPEQARDANAVGWASDIYSLGAIAFELLIGRPPFVANTTIELVTMHLEQMPERPSSLIPEIPDEIDQLVLAMLAKNPLDRPTLGHIRSMLERVRGVEPQRVSPVIQMRNAPRATNAEELTPVPDPSFVEVRFRPTPTPNPFKGEGEVLDSSALRRLEARELRTRGAAQVVTLPPPRHDSPLRLILIVVALVTIATIIGLVVVL